MNTYFCPCGCAGDGSESHIYWMLRHECIISGISRPDNELEYYL